MQLAIEKEAGIQRRGFWSSEGSPASHGGWGGEEGDLGWVQARAGNVFPRQPAGKTENAPCLGVGETLMRVWGAQEGHRERWRCGTQLGLPGTFFLATRSIWSSGPGIRSQLQVPPSLQLWQCQLLNPPCRAGVQICVPVLLRHCRSHCTAGFDF